MNLILVSDVQQMLKKELFGNNWIHLATVKMNASNFSKERFFMCLLDKNTSKTYIEEYVDFPEFFIKIEETKLWNDIYMFLVDKQILTVSLGKEFKFAKKE